MENIDSGLSNYYGTVCVESVNDRYYMTLDNYNGTNQVEVSKEFYDSFVKEFKN